MIKKVSLLILILVGIAVVGVLLFVDDVDVTLTEDQVQAEIDKKIEAGPIKSRGVVLTLNSAIIDFKANDKAEIDVDLAADGFGYSGSMRGIFVSGIRYDQPQIFLDDIATPSIELTTDQETGGKIKDIQNVASDFCNVKKMKCYLTKPKSLSRISLAETRMH